MNDRYAKAMEYVRACRRCHDEHLLESRKVRRRLAMYQYRDAGYIREV